MMPVIAWNALHATRILREAMRVLQDALRRRHPRRRGALPRAARSQHRARDGAQPVHRLRRDGRDRQGRRSRPGRSIRDLVRERRLLPDDQLDAILSAEAMTSPGVPGSRTTDSDSEDRCSDTHWRRSLLVSASLAAAPATHSTDGCSIRRISGCSRARIATRGSGRIRSWTRCGIADGSVVADLGAGGGWFTVRLARRVGPNGIVYAEDIQRQMIEAINRRVEREGLQNA